MGVGGEIRCPPLPARRQLLPSGEDGCNLEASSLAFCVGGTYACEWSR